MTRIAITRTSGRKLYIGPELRMRWASGEGLRIDYPGEQGWTEITGDDSEAIFDLMVEAIADELAFVSIGPEDLKHQLEELAKAATS